MSQDNYDTSESAGSVMVCAEITSMTGDLECDVGPGHARDVALWCRTCPVCAARKSPNPKRRASLHTISTHYPMQTVAVDILGLIPTTPSQNRYILVAEDYFTR